MLKTITALLLSLAMLASFKSFADTPYIGIDYILGDIDISSENAEPSLTAIRAGVSNNQIAFEAQYLISNNSDNIYRMEFDLEKSVGLFTVLQSETMSGFRFDVSLGYAMNELTVSGPENTYNSKDEYNGFAWGVSIQQELPFFDKAQVRLGYQSLYKDSDLEITGISLGLTYQF